jgi:hypothetical protein
MKHVPVSSPRDFRPIPLNEKSRLRVEAALCFLSAGFSGFCGLPTTVPSSTVPTRLLAPNNEGYEAGKYDDDDAYKDTDSEHLDHAGHTLPFNQIMSSLRGYAGLVKWHTAQTWPGGCRGRLGSGEKGRYGGKLSIVNFPLLPLPAGEEGAG